MNEVMRRPIYAEYAWAFDLLIERPVRKECAVIVAWLLRTIAFGTALAVLGVACLAGQADPLGCVTRPIFGPIVMRSIKAPRLSSA